MRPEFDTVINSAVGTFMAEVLPHVGVDYAASNAGVICLMLLMAGEEYDRAADVRYRENNEMRALFADAADAITDNELAERLRDAAASSDESLRISALNAANDDLRRLLIDLHACVEEEEGDGARKIDRGIWDFLRRSAADRSYAFIQV